MSVRWIYLTGGSVLGDKVPWSGRSKVGVGGEVVVGLPVNTCSARVGLLVPEPMVGFSRGENEGSEPIVGFSKGANDGFVPLGFSSGEKDGFASGL